MPRFAKIVRELKKQREGAQAQVDKLGRAIQALSEIGGRSPGRRPGLRELRPRRHMSAAGRKRIADAQRKRWARVRAEKAAKGRK